MTTDTVIVGGGPAGSSLALFLAAHDRAVLQIDAPRTADFKPGEGLIPATRRILQDLQLWADFQAQNHQVSYGNDSLWGASTVQSTDFIRSIDGPGWHLDRLAFDDMLRRKAGEAGAGLLEDFVERAEGRPGEWILQLRSGKQVRSRWLVDATGRSARIARQLGSQRQDEDRLVAFYVVFRPGAEGDQYGGSLIESRPEGWWYNALLPGNRRIVYFFTDADHPKRSKVQHPEGFQQLLGETKFVKERLEKYDYQPLGAPQAADARSARLDRMAGDHWLAVGDAALSFDPLSSQGIMTAMYGGLKAGNALLKGTAEAVANYGQAMEAVWKQFAMNRLKYYTTESRWPREIFWQRRRAVRA